MRICSSRVVCRFKFSVMSLFTSQITSLRVFTQYPISEATVDACHEISPSVRLTSFVTGLLLPKEGGTATYCPGPARAAGTQHRPRALILAHSLCFRLILRPADEHAHALRYPGPNTRLTREGARHLRAPRRRRAPALRRDRPHLRVRCHPEQRPSVPSRASACICSRIRARRAYQTRAAS